MEQGGEGLMGMYYDACVGWYHTQERQNTMSFTQGWGKLENSGLMRKTTTAALSSSTERDLNGARVGVMDGWASNKGCMSRAEYTNFEIVKFDHTEDLLAAAVSGDVTYIFALENGVAGASAELTWEGVGHNTHQCFLGGLSVMTRHDSLLSEVWDRGMDRILTNGVYNDLCSKWAGKIDEVNAELGKSTTFACQ